MGRRERWLDSLKAKEDLMELTGVFSDYRHEWAAGDFNDRFVKPPYYEKFVGYEPVFLLGGRGTGKTVTLRSLNFRNATEHSLQTGIYVKAFKNRVEAFSTAKIDSNTQIRAFEHYMNLLCCFELVELCVRLHSRQNEHQAIDHTLTLAATHFGISGPHYDLTKLRNDLRLQIAKLSAFINDPSGQIQPKFSHGEIPVVDLAKDIHDIWRLNGPMYICIDEWENLSENQQQALNRWIKNCERPITYKIGVREGGIRTLDTGRSIDPLHTPADYIETRADGSNMKSFCKNVVEHRLRSLKCANNAIPAKLSGLLETLDRQAEATKLGANIAVKNAISSGKITIRKTSSTWLREQQPGDAYLALFVAERTGFPLDHVISKAIDDPEHWKNTKNNYGHLSLFSITRGLKGTARQKFYAGEKTYLELSGGNVRYLLELLDEAVLEEFSRSEPDTVATQLHQISAETQTTAAITVARRRLRQVEVLSDRGLEVLRLVIVLGTAFAALVREPGRHAPERTSFTLRGQRQDVDELAELINEGCSILAFVREPTTKRTSATEPKDHEYRIHPVLTPHFCIPYRKKRKSKIDAAALKEALHSEDAARSLVRRVVGMLESDPTQDSLL